METYPGIELVYGEQKQFCTAWADKSSQGRAKISCTDTTSPMNQLAKCPFHLYSLNLHSPQFQQSAGATPLYCLWSTYLINLFLEKDTTFSVLYFYFFLDFLNRSQHSTLQIHDHVLENRGAIGRNPFSIS
jgi:hypothetical protein